ncbi:MAG: methyltransferase domain-containing protein, partial [Planctomycetales bacterium]
FADKFDATLEQLDYQGPRRIADQAAAWFGSRDEPADVLDAGCGTGLCGPLLRPIARRLEGVDLSEKMLAKAAERDAYDELHLGELTEHLENRRADLDLIGLADTFIYIGELEPFFTAAQGALRAGGAVVATFQQCHGDGADFLLTPTGRYAHAEGYIRRVLDATGFEIRAFDSAVSRYESGVPDLAHVVLAERRAD